MIELAELIERLTRAYQAADRSNAGALHFVASVATLAGDRHCVIAIAADDRAAREAAAKALTG